MPDRILLESGAPDGILLEDASGVIIREMEAPPVGAPIFDTAKRSTFIGVYQGSLADYDQTFIGVHFDYSPVASSVLSVSQLDRPVGYLEFKWYSEINGTNNALFGVANAAYDWTVTQNLGWTAGSWSYRATDGVWYEGSSTPVFTGVPPQ